MNVIPVSDRDTDTITATLCRPQILTSARDTALACLAEAFKSALEHSDDALFKLAEKSDSNAQQSLYFDAMRELRLKREAMEAAFKDGFLAAFEQRRKRAAPAKMAAPGAPMKLALIDDAAMEEDIAVANLVDKMTTASREELFGLNKRMAALLEVTEVSAEDNPIGPKCIAGAIRDACSGLEVDLKVRLIFLKLFDRHVASDVAAIYSRVNEHLIALGVLPIIHTEVRRGYVARRGTVVSSSAPAAPASSTELLGMLECLLQPIAAGATVAASHAQSVACDPVAFTALTRLQHSNSELAAIGGVGGGATVNILRQLKGSGAVPPLGPAGAMTIDIVAMLFDYILDDKNLPEPIRALLARLQIPVLKVALIDREFFSKKSHAARRLLNAIAEAALQAAGDPSLESGVQQAVESIVQRIVAEFDNDVRIFAEGVKSLKQTLSEMRHEAKVRAARTAKLLEGRSRLEIAKGYAREAVETRLRPEGITEAVGNFLLTHWKHLIITLFVKDGEESESLRGAVRTMDELVWSVLPKTTPQERDKLGKLLPGLLAHLKRGMESISMPAMARSSFLAKLASAHTEAMRGAANAAARQPLSEVAVDDTDTQTPAPAAISQRSSPDADTVLDITTGTWGAESAHSSVAAGPAKLPETIAPVETPCSASLDPRKKAMLAAIMQRVREAQPRALPAETGNSCSEERGDASNIVEQRADGSSSPNCPVHPRVPADIRKAMHEIRTEPPAPPQIEAAATVVPSVPSQQPVALSVLEKARTAAEELRDRLAAADEVKIADVLNATSRQVERADAPAAEKSVLDITANTFYRMFSSGGRGNESLAKAESFNIEELTLGDTRNPVVRMQEDAYLRSVGNLEPGTWLEFQCEDGSTLRARFTWYNANTDTYMFTDRNGRKVADRTRHGLVAEFKRGTVKVTRDAPLLDRAFTRLMDALNLGRQSPDKGNSRL